MDKELAFVLACFSRYYSKAQFSIPEIEKREFGVGVEKKIDFRHLSFNNSQELASYLANNTPLYVSHSVAYYQLPKATPMERKGWLGADLVFDLDYKAERKYMSREEFERVRADALRLIEEFLIPDFGISLASISVNFSGNRGFHIHVRDSRFRNLRSEERKEIIEYIKGIGLSYDAFFTQKEISLSGRHTVLREQGPKPESGGYAGRFARKVLAILKEKPESLSRIFKDSFKRDAFTKGIMSGNWSMRTATQGLEKKLREIVEKELPLHTVNIDSGVTQDITKLIRVPDSIHGSTGLAARTISFHKLVSFEPMHHAVVLPEKGVKIIAMEDIPDLEMGGTTQEKIGKGESREVPCYFAIYLKLKEVAKLLI